MSVSSPFILRPIATSLLAIAVMLSGLLGYFGLPVSSLPQVDFPTIQVTTQLPGASSRTMADLVTAPLERQLGQISSLDTMISTSSFGISQITMQFGLDRDIDAAAQDVQSAINAAGSVLPKTLPYPPTYAKVNPADTPIVTVALTSDEKSFRSLSDFADTLLAQRLSSVSGVGNVSVQGGIKPAVRVQADIGRLASYGLSLVDLRTAIASANVSGPKGAVDSATQTYTIAANDQLSSADAYRNVVITYRNGAPVRLRDVADIKDGLENARVSAWYQGKPAILIDVLRQPGANVIDTVARLKRELPRLQRALPNGVSLFIIHDRTGMIKASVRDVQFTLVIAVALVVLVVFLFLRNVGATIIAGVALPVSLIATFGIMWLAGFSLDNLSLMALTIGTGFIIDDAIVMIENIVRHLEKGTRPLQAALIGAQEIGFTVISLTLSLLAVFIPLLFMSGLVGRMFREFALTLTIAVTVSAVVSLTLTPMMCAYMLRRPTEDHGAPARGVTGFLAAAVNAIVDLYRRSLEVVLRHETMTLLVTIATVILTVWLYIQAPKGFLPLQDTGLVAALVEASPDVSFPEMERLQQTVVTRLRQDGNVSGISASVGVSRGNTAPNIARLSIILKPLDDRHAFVTEIIKQLQERVRDLPGIKVHFQPVQDIQIATRPSRAQYQYTLTSTSQKDVSEWSQKLTETLKDSPRLQDVSLETLNGGLRALLDVDRTTAARLGVSMQAINDALNDAFGQRQVSTIYGQANQYRVILEAAPQFRVDTTDLSRLYVASSSGQQVPVLAFAKVKLSSTSLAIDHQEQFPAATISFNLAQDASLSEAITLVAAAQSRIAMPDSVTGTFFGDAAEFRKSLDGQPWLILAAIVTIYIVLGVLYESFIHPLTILTTLPSAGIGAVLALHLTGLDLSLVALIGIILLMGIVKKNAIMMIDFALDAERERGMTPREAIVEACHLRFRPIMMTTMAALLAALPLVLENGTGSELRYPLGVTIIGGLILSQMLTLYTTPVVYLALDRLKRRLTGQPAVHSDAAAE